MILLKVLIDIDGVVLDMCGAIASRLPGFNPDSVIDYGFRCSCGAPRYQIMRYLGSLMTFKVQNPYPDSISGIKLLKDAGVDTYAYTEVPFNIVEYRNSQIKVLGLSGEAYAYGEKPANVSGYAAIFEDNPATLDKWTNGICKYIIDRPYNRGYSGALRFSNLHDAAEYFVRNVLTKTE